MFNSIRIVVKRGASLLIICFTSKIKKKERDLTENNNIFEDLLKNLSHKKKLSKKSFERKNLKKNLIYVTSMSREENPNYRLEE